MIEQAREELHKALEKSDPETILRLSRKLDRLIVAYMMKSKIPQS